jgi:lysyl endopeptidase
MKKIVLILGSILPFAGIFGQTTSLVHLDGEPKVKVGISNDVPSLKFVAPNREVLRAEDEARDKQGKPYRYGLAHFTNITTQNSGRWTELNNGMKVWQLKLKSKDAEALSFTFTQFALSTGAQFWIENKNIGYSTKMFNQSCVLEDGQLIIDLVWGDDVVLNLLQPSNEIQSEISINRVFHDYRSTGTPYNTAKYHNFGGSEACEVNANATPAGDAWTAQNRGVAMINVIDGGGQYFCSGSLINNLANDCKPYFLTANHCGITTSAADFALWKFHFRFESIGGTNPGSVGTLANNFITGCLKVASTTDGGETSSDFLLVKLGTVSNEASVITTLKSTPFTAYWNGWDAAATIGASGAGIHHPNGDIKKISTYTATPTATGWNNTTYSSHWMFSWTANVNGWGVTEGGSSGSPLFNNSGKIIGTLTGGGSYCTAQSSPDLYGKFAWHWSNAQNGSTNARKLQPWLDPTNTGVTTMAGSYNPCTVIVPAIPVAQFIGTPTTLNTGGIVAFTDQSTGVPTTWAWVITPATGWNYSTGTAASQNPSVTFTTAGTYTVQLTASNGIGSDVELKNAYIVVTDPLPVTCVTPSALGWSMGFESTEDMSGLTTINANGDANPWSVVTANATFLAHLGTQFAGYQFSTPNAADDYITTPCFSFVGGTSYTVSYWYKAQEATYPEKMTVKLGTDNTLASSFTQTIFDHPSITNIAYIQKIATFTAPSTGDFYITFYCHSAADQYVLSLDDINIKITDNSGLLESDLTSVGLYPTPTNDVLNVDLSHINGNVSIEIIDMMGKVIKTTTSNGSSIEALDVKNLSHGTYNLKISSATESLVKRFVKK